MSDIIIRVKDVQKKYLLYDNVSGRLKEALSPLRKKYHKVHYALESVSFELKRGETVGIIGRNGAGKSTLLKIITGVLNHDKGTIETKGRITSLLELGTGFNPELSGMDNIFFNGLIMGFDSEYMESKIDDIIKFAAIGDYIHQPVSTYSSGMFARLAFAVAISVEPDILIVDEALSVGDLAFQKKCLNRIREMKDNGVTILLVSHDEYTVKFFCERALYLIGGKQKFFGAASDAVDLYMHDLREEIKQNNICFEKEIDDNTCDNDEALMNKVLKDAEFAVNISNIRLTDMNDTDCEIIKTEDSIRLVFDYEVIGVYSGEFVFVANLYRHDDLYVSGSTTLMDKYTPFHAHDFGRVEMIIDRLPVLSGEYIWRVAVNDESGIGILAEAVPVCPFKVVDEMGSVGTIHLQRKWKSWRLDGKD